MVFGNRGTILLLAGCQALAMTSMGVLATTAAIIGNMLAANKSLSTLPVALQRYVGEYKTEWGHFAAGALLVSLPVMGLFFALQRYLVGGLTAGAVKG